jgi:hypothetical protein
MHEKTAGGIVKLILWQHRIIICMHTAVVVEQNSFLKNLTPRWLVLHEIENIVILEFEFSIVPQGLAQTSWRDVVQVELTQLAGSFIIHLGLS